jgi:hypothetical protein
MLLCLLLALLLPLAPGAATAPADTTDDGIEVGFRIIPNAFYSPTRGFGGGGGIVFRNVGAPGTEFALSAQTMQRFGRYRASFFTGDPFRVPVFAGIAAQYETNQVRAFYGLGPQSNRDDKIYASIESVEIEARVGWYALGAGRLIVQPVVRLLHTNVRSFRDLREDAFLQLDPASQRTLFDAVGEPTTGLTYGLELAYDNRDRLLYSSRGTLLLLTARRYDGLGDGAFRYYSGTGSLYGFVPLSARRHVLFARAVVALTRQIGDEPLPFYALPVLDNDLLGAYSSFRFTGHDLLVLTAGYRFPVFTFLNWFAFDANVSVSAANAYDDLFDQFRPSVSFDTDPAVGGRRTGLRPAIAAGVNFVNLEKDRVVIGGQVGFGPEGFRFGTIQLVYGIRDARPLVR